MPLPLSYNLKNLTVRRTTTLMTALGIGLTVAVLLGILALVGGLERALQSTGASASSAGIEEELPLGVGQPDQPRGRVEHPKQTGDSSNWTASRWSLRKW